MSLVAPSEGNNNAYCQDSDISWVNWGFGQTESVALVNFVRKLTRLRQRYSRAARVTVS